LGGFNRTSSIATDLDKRLSARLARRRIGVESDARRRIGLFKNDELAKSASRDNEVYERVSAQTFWTPSP